MPDQPPSREVILADSLPELKTAPARPGLKQNRASQLADRGEFGEAYTFVALHDRCVRRLLWGHPSRFRLAG
jgi:hypothetical protein